VAHLVDRVLAAAPVRHRVLSLPFEIRRLAVSRAEVATAMGRTFIEEIASVQDQAAATNGATFVLGLDLILDGLERGLRPRWPHQATRACPFGP
jgi:hypothetical protein